FCVFFVFYFYDATPNRHSFPTRRSSDLTDARDVVVHVRRQERLQHAVLTQPDVRGTERPELVGEQARQVPLTLRAGDAVDAFTGDRKSTRLNSSHVKISYAVFCLKKKNT